MNGVHSTRSTSLVTGDGLPSKALMAAQPHRHSAGELEDALNIDWDRLQLPQRSNASSSSESVRSGGESYIGSRRSSGTNAQQRDVALILTEDDNIERQRKLNGEAGNKRNGQTSDGNSSTAGIQQTGNVVEVYEGIFVNMGFVNQEEVELIAEKQRKLKQNVELPLSMRKASLEASLRLSSGAEGRSRYTLDNKFTSVVDKTKEQANAATQINKTTSMPEIKESLAVELSDDCLPLPIVHSLRTAPTNIAFSSLYSNPLRYTTKSPRMTRKEAVDAQMDVESYAFSQLASIGWW
uniref:Uncharacterized protein n=1 Tax=Plectus sambesii TaxID=2011161 RepID=A0A914V142_9BILA